MAGATTTLRPCTWTGDRLPPPLTFLLPWPDSRRCTGVTCTVTGDIEALTLHTNMGLVQSGVPPLGWRPNRPAHLDVIVAYQASACAQATTTFASKGSSAHAGPLGPWPGLETTLAFLIYEGNTITSGLPDDLPLAFPQLEALAIAANISSTLPASAPQLRWPLG